MDIDEYMDHEPSDAELAACALVMEVFRSSSILAYVSEVLLDRVDKVDFPGEPKEGVVIRRFTGLVVPKLAAGGAEASWKAAELVQLIRERIVEDFELEMAADGHNN